MDKIGPSFSLSELIESTANELRIVRDKHAADPVIQLSSCELELDVTVKAEAGGGIKFWVVDATATGSGETSSKITLKFNTTPGAAIAAFAGAQGDAGPPAQRLPKTPG